MYSQKVLPLQKSYNYTMEEEGKYDSITVAKFMMAYGREHKIPMNITKLNKLLYALYGVYIAMVGHQLTDEQPHAWPYGPVFPKVREDFIKNNGYNEYTVDNPLFDEMKKDDDFMACLKFTMEYYGQYNATSLVNWTHKSKSPWTKTTKEDYFDWDDPICNEYMIDYFKKVCRWTKEN